MIGFKQIFLKPVCNIAAEFHYASGKQLIWNQNESVHKIVHFEGIPLNGQSTHGLLYP